MATYKKTGSKLRKGRKGIEDKSTTAEVFNTLDQTASKSEMWVIKNQKAIFYVLAGIVLIILGYLAYQKYIQGPKEKEAADELAFPKTYFEQAMDNEVALDSLLTLGLNGADGKFGFVDISNEYSGTKAGNLANYYAGMSYLRLRNYPEAIAYLEKFSSDDELLAPLAKGAIGDAFADINQPKDAYDYYLEAAKITENSFTTPIFLFKAANTAMDLENYNDALKLFNRIKNDFPNSSEADDIDIYISKATHASK